MVRAWRARRASAIGGGVLVVVQQPVQRLVAVSGGVGGGAVLGVAADQVVHAVPAVAGLGQQALAVQGIQQPGRLG